MPTSRHSPLQTVNDALAAVAQEVGRAPARLLAVSKTQPAEAIRALAMQGQRAFGENYVQEALRKQTALALRPFDKPGVQGDWMPALEWHLVGHLQSNKAAEAACAFDWVQSLDRTTLVGALARHRPAEMAPLNVLIQVNIDDEASKHGCRPDQITALAEAIAAQPRLRLRGLMAIPAPHPELEVRKAAFRAMKGLFDALASGSPDIDTLSMGMSADYAIAAAEGATLVRVGTALFGPRPQNAARS